MEYDANQDIIRVICQQVEFADKTVLEVGCGEADISSRLALGTRSYIGIDPDENAIGQAQKRYAHKCQNLDLRIGTGESLDFDDLSFDLVLFTLSLHHQNSVAALKEAHRVLKDSGRLIVLEPSATGEFQQFFHLFNDETDRIGQACHHLMDSAFALENQERCEALVRFEDTNDLCAYGFDRDRVSPEDNNRILTLLERLRPGASSPVSSHYPIICPVILTDCLDLYLMAKA